jgi:uncharacterized protein YjeT (DUF2065 family)
MTTDAPPLGRTRLSLYYLAGYSLPSGLALLFAPALTLKLLFSNGHYSELIVRLVGIPLACLGVIVVQLIRHRVAVLYPTTLAVRVFILASVGWLYSLSGDPMFLALLGVVGFGFVLTLSCYLLDRSAARAAA